MKLSQIFLNAAAFIGIFLITSGCCYYFSLRKDKSENAKKMKNGYKVIVSFGLFIVVVSFMFLTNFCRGFH